MSTWYEEHPEWLATELCELEATGIDYARDEESFKRGIARLNLKVPIAGAAPIALTVTFPALYPYFRFEVQAPELSLTHHQNPFEKNLCLLARTSAAWDPTDTVASVLKTQLEKLLKTATAHNAADVVGQELVQAEPVSVFYRTEPLSSIIVQSQLCPPAAKPYGRMHIGTQTPLGQRPTLPVRGAVLRMLDDGSAVVAEASTATLRGFGGTVISGMWGRLPAPILIPKHFDFLEALLEQLPALNQAPTNQVQGGFIRVWAVLFPEEVGHRKLGEGWMFLCHFEENVNRLHRNLKALRGKAPKPR